ncbi:MAG TPA: hypothetical protein VK989_06900 [Polyangia bacterium]|jgi:hypothetical protein|nr:hypothetical protein [Polyangia bacterium]
MSGNIRTLRAFNIGIISAALIASVMFVRAIAASPETVLDDPPISIGIVSRAEVEDVALAQTIHAFALVARAPRVAETP